MSFYVLLSYSLRVESDEAAKTNKHSVELAAHLFSKILRFVVLEICCTHLNCMGALVAFLSSVLPSTPIRLPRELKVSTFSMCSPFVVRSSILAVLILIFLSLQRLIIASCLKLSIFPACLLCFGQVGRFRSSAFS